MATAGLEQSACATRKFSIITMATSSQALLFYLISATRLFLQNNIYTWTFQGTLNELL